MSVNFKEKIFPLIPGLVLLSLSLIIGLIIYPDYGISWDEVFQRAPGILSWEYIFHGNKDLFKDAVVDNHGAGFELLLVFFEKTLRLTDSRDIYLSRHIITHIFFLLSAFTGYLLCLRVYKNKWIASLGFVMLVVAPRIYAHSYFNSKDIPFMAMITIILYLCHLTFDKNKAILWALLGLATGYATSIRIMGIMFFVFIILLFLVDYLINGFKNKNHKKEWLNIGVFIACSVFSLVISWPYLWPDPINNFIQSFNEMANYTQWGGSVFFQGEYIKGTEVPPFYLLVWFWISNPVVWLFAGIAGMIWVLQEFIANFQTSFKNTPVRNFMFYVLCFVAPVVSVIVMHSVIYDDWRHLYFIYPPFVMLGLFVVYKLWNTKLKVVIVGIFLLQVIDTGYFMVKYHPFQQVYFNEMVSHSDNYLRENYDLEYWGCGFKQELDYILADSKADTIKICCNFNEPVRNNILLLKPAARKRIMMVDISEIRNADYFLTNFRGHPEEYPSKNIGYSASVLNSKILCVYKLKKTPPQPKSQQ